MDSETSCAKHLRTDNLIACSVCGKFKVDCPKEDFVIHYGDLGARRWMCASCYRVMKLLEDDKNVDLKMIVTEDGVYTKDGKYYKNNSKG